MDLIQIETLALTLMHKHDLVSWKFGWNRAKRSRGRCNHTRKLISLPITTSPLRHVNALTNTILHEIAHALVGGGHGHGHVWKTKALEIGCNGKRNSIDHIDIEHKYHATCTNCGRVIKRHRRPSRDSSCNRCSKGVFNFNYILIWKKQH